MKVNHINLNLNFPLQYYQIKNSEEYIVLLHGYRLHARKALLDFEGMIPSKYSILAPCGPFPIPKSDNSISRMGYSWYFSDHRTGKTIFSVDNASDLLVNLMDQLSILAKPVTIIGFSQGGIVGLSLAKKLKNVRKIILLSTNPFYSEPDTMDKKLNILAFHGEEDSLMNFESSLNAYQNLRSNGHNVELQSFKDVGHNLSTEYKTIHEQIKNFLE